MLPSATAANLYNKYCQWQTPTSELHQSLGHDTLWSQSRAAGLDCAQSHGSMARIGARARQYGFAAGAGTSLVLAAGDMVIGTGRDRGAAIVGPNLGASTAAHLGVTLEHFGDTGLLGVAHGVPIALHAGVFAVIGAAIGLVLSAGDYVIAGGAAVDGDSQGTRCRRRLAEWAGLGAIAGAALITLPPGGLGSLAILGMLRAVTAAIKAVAVAVTFAAGALVGIAVELGTLAADVGTAVPRGEALG